MAAALEDKMTLTFRNEMTEMKNMMKAFVPTPVPIKAVEESVPLVPSTSTSTSMVPTTLPSNTITNPRGEVRAITTRSGLSYTPVPPIPPPLYDENEPLTEKETEVTKDKVLPSTKNIQPPVIQKSHDPVKPVSSPISPEPSSAQVDNSPPSKESSKETKLPYPSRVEREKKDSNDKVQIQKFWEMFKKIHVDITLADALILMPKYQKMLKSLLTNKDKLIEIAKTPMNANCSAVILKKLPEKLGDPGFSSFLTKEVFETKVEPEKKKELQVFHPDIEILDHLETTSYVGSDYVFYEDFNLVDMIFPMNIQGKIFDPGISHFENDAFQNKSSKELAPSKALLTLDVFDPLHPPLMNFHVTKAFSGFTFSILKIFSKKFFEPGIKNVLVYLSSLVWGGKDIKDNKEAKSGQNRQRNGKVKKKSEDGKPMIKAGSV
ncbi:hypothetical protein Tco_1319427 [Tanacetum coccineum]